MDFFSSSFRTLRSFIPGAGVAEEGYGFARFRGGSQGGDVDNTEMSSLRENGASSTVAYCGSTGGNKLNDNNSASIVRTRSQSLGGIYGMDMSKDPDAQSTGEYEEHFGDETGNLKPGTKISAWQAGWNVTNAIQGMFIVTFPYTVFEGGYWALIAMIVVAYVCCYTGKILVDCLYEDVQWKPGGGTSDAIVWEKRRVRNSYVGIAEAVWGKRFGGRIVYAAQLIELLMTCILYVLLCGMLMVGMFPDTPLDLTAWVMVYTVVLLPCAFLRNLRHVAWLSFWCTVAHLFINGIILIYCFTLVYQWQFDVVQIQVDIWTFPLSLGIVVFSYTSQIFLPSLEGSLSDRSKFACMMHWTHFAAAIFKVAFAYIGFVTFGLDTKEVITNNLPSQTMKVIVNFFLIAKALLSYPLPYFATAELLEAKFFLGAPETSCPSCYDETGTLKLWSLTLRLGLVIFTMLLAIFIPHFALLMSLIGSFTGNMLSLVWPVFFHLSLKGHTLRWPQKAVNVGILLMGLVCSGLGIYYSTHALVRAFQGFEPKPFQRH